MLLCLSVCTESGQPICGNGLVEGEEQCDCGYSDQCKDACCYDANEVEGKKCKLKPGKICRSDVFVQTCYLWSIIENSIITVNSMAFVWFSTFVIPQSQPRPMLHTRVYVQGHKWQVQTWVWVCPRGLVQWSWCSMSCLRTKGKLHLLPFRNSSLPQWGMLVWVVFLLFLVWYVQFVCEIVFVFKVKLFFPLLPVCLDQACSGSICEKYSLEVCTCASQQGMDEAAELCHVCCMEKSECP